MKEKKLLKIVSLVLILLIVAGAAILQAKHHYHITKRNGNNKQSSISPAITSSYQYKKLETYSFGSKGKAMLFSKPVEMVKLGEIPKNSSQIMLIHFTDQRISPDYGRIAAASADNFDQAASVNSLTSQLANMGSKVNATIKSFKSFIDPRLPLTYSTDGFKGFAPFSSDNLSANTWSSDFDAKSSNSSMPKIEGRFLIAVGKNTIYYFMAENVSSTWQANQGIWQQVFNSIKIDQ